MLKAPYHKPVLMHEAIEGLDVHNGGVYVDLTFGGGGHSREILKRLGERGKLYGFDQDADASENAPDDKRFTFVHSNFRFFENWLLYYGQKQIDGILVDLGVSSHQFDTPERGFSFRYDAPLDMRMNLRSTISACTIVNEYGEERLANILYQYGELSESRRLALAIVTARNEKKLMSTQELSELIKPLLGRDNDKKKLAKVFQALRIEVNSEMDSLKEALQSAVAVLKQGGRLVTLTYHSLEDRIVKNMMKKGNVDGIIEQDAYGQICTPLRQVGKIKTPSQEEQQENPRSRSAKLRIGEKLYK